MTGNTRLTPQQHRAALEVLGRDRLIVITDHFGLDVGDRRVVENHVNALVRSRSVEFGDVLALLKSEELRAICDALGLERNGCEKEVLVERILTLGGPAQPELPTAQGEAGRSEMRAAHARGEQLGLGEDELAFYDALGVNDATVRVMGDKVLKAIAKELTKTIRRNVSIDWTQREIARAKLRTLVRRLLRKHGYPPDKQEQATQTVMEQEERLCETRAGDAAKVIPFPRATYATPDLVLPRVAEEQQPLSSCDASAAPDPSAIASAGRRLLAAISEEDRRKHLGEFAAVDVETGAVFFASNEMDAVAAARTARAGARVFFARIGSDAAYELRTP